MEAIIIISSFVMFMLSILFFKNMYLRAMRTERLARATVIAYSMQGCPPNQDPAEWASNDLDPKAGKNTPAPSTTSVHTPNQPALSSKRATKIMGELPGGGSNGSSLNPIATLGLSMKAAAMSKKNAVSTNKGYSVTMSSTSYVSCADAVRDDDFSGIVGYALSKFSLFGGNEEDDHQ